MHLTPKYKIPKNSGAIVFSKYSKRFSIYACLYSISLILTAFTGVFVFFTQSSFLAGLLFSLLWIISFVIFPLLFPMHLIVCFFKKRRINFRLVFIAILLGSIMSSATFCSQVESRDNGKELSRVVSPDNKYTAVAFDIGTLMINDPPNYLLVQIENNKTGYIKNIYRETYYTDIDFHWVDNDTLFINGNYVDIDD